LELEELLGSELLDLKSYFALVSWSKRSSWLLPLMHAANLFLCPSNPVGSATGRLLMFDASGFLRHTVKSPATVAATVDNGEKHTSSELRKRAILTGNTRLWSAVWADEMSFAGELSLLRKGVVKTFSLSKFGVSASTVASSSNSPPLWLFAKLLLEVAGEAGVYNEFSTSFVSTLNGDVPWLREY
jgi:hypothetical protein